ncbi:MAG TPA: SDR family oxidoreductase [Xanthobacteraceae bacterium]|nr:SDR family oxidoreductase [Xanthobacteraceae bacterium]
MAGELHGRVALVTGAASGMGRVMARALAAADASVAGLDVDTAGLGALAAEREFGGRLLTLTADVSKPSDGARAVEKVVQAFGRLDILVNCAGVSMAPAAPRGQGRAKFFETNPEGFLRILAINMGGAFLMACFAAQEMLRNDWGRIINITTSFDTMLAGGLSGYGAAKAALEASTASWAKDLAGTGVTCNILVPGGPTDTAFFPDGQPKPPVLIDPQVMAAPAVWLASSASDGISGCRFIARDWDQRLPPSEAAARVRAPAAWPTLADGAQNIRGVAI